MSRFTRKAAVVLRWVLIVNGVLTLFALPAVFLPTAWMNAFHLHLGLGPLPDGPIVQYLARSISALYAAFGSLTLLIVWDLKRYSPLVTWWGLMALLFGAVLLWVDLTFGMPPHWTWGEGPYLLGTGFVVLSLQRMGRG